MLLRDWLSITLRTKCATFIYQMKNEEKNLLMFCAMLCGTKMYYWQP